MIGSINTGRIPTSAVSSLPPVIAKQRTALTELCHEYRVQRLELFGSALRNDFDGRRSDLDFMVEFEPLPAGTYASNFLGFKEAREKLFDLPVDLITASAIRNPYFRRTVEDSKALLYAA